MGFLRRSKSRIRQRRGGIGGAPPIGSPSPLGAKRTEQAARAGVLPGGPPRGWTLAAAKRVPILTGLTNKSELLISGARAFASGKPPKPRSAEAAESDRKNAAVELEAALKFAIDTQKFYEEGSGPDWKTRISNVFPAFEPAEDERKKNYALLLGEAIYKAWNNHVEDKKLQQAKQFLVTAANNDLDAVGYGVGKVVIDGVELPALGSNDGDAVKSAIWWAQQLQTGLSFTTPYVDEKKLSEVEEKYRKRGPQGKALGQKVDPGGGQLIFALDARYDGAGGGRKPRKSRKNRKSRKSRKPRRSRKSRKH